MIKGKIFEFIIFSGNHPEFFNFESKLNNTVTLKYVSN